MIVPTLFVSATMLTNHFPMMVLGIFWKTLLEIKKVKITITGPSVS